MMSGFADFEACFRMEYEIKWIKNNLERALLYSVEKIKVFDTFKPPRLKFFEF